jgi:hypothetical protein
MFLGRKVINVYLPVEIMFLGNKDSFDDFERLISTMRASDEKVSVAYRLIIIV